jgi:FkbM family methyltransferase
MHDEGSRIRQTQCLLSDALGHRVQLDNQEGIVSRPGEYGHLLYGPYEPLPSGRYQVEFQIGLDEIPPGRLGDFICATLDVAANTGATILAQRQIRRAELSSHMNSITISFSLSAPRALEYRVLTNGQAGIVVGASPTITRLADEPPKAAPRGSLERAWDNEREFLDGYLRNVSGVIHIGANTGQERRLYQIIGLDVLWVEAMEDVYETLLDNIAPFPRQRAVRALLTDTEGEAYSFNVSNIGGASSSILPFQDHAVIAPYIEYVDKREILSTTFRRLVESEQIDLNDYQALTLDIEGSELLALRGAGDLLEKFEYIKCEVSDFPSRTGAPTSADLDEYLGQFGFEQLARRAFAYGPDGNGTYWDIIWKKQYPDKPLYYPGVSLPIITNDPSPWDHRLNELLLNLPPWWT